MNTKTEILNLPDYNPNPVAQKEVSTRPTQLHRKIAKLPGPLRDLINSSLDDNLSSREIIEKLQACTNPSLPYPISEVNISNWRRTGYQRHLADRDRTTLLEADHQRICDLLTAFFTPKAAKLSPKKSANPLASFTPLDSNR